MSISLETLYKVRVPSPVQPSEVEPTMELGKEVAQITTSDSVRYFGSIDRLPCVEVTVTGSPVFEFPLEDEPDEQPLSFVASSGTLGREYAAIANALSMRGLFEGAIEAMRTAQFWGWQEGTELKANHPATLETHFI